MVLLLLVILAVLVWAIQLELEPERRAEQSVEGPCPACRKVVDIDMIVCPHCQQQLREACSHCHRSKLISHPHCPFCGEKKGAK